MIGALKKLFGDPAGNEERGAAETRKLAAAALLIEVARADSTQDAQEEQAMASLLCDSLGLAADDVAELLAEADREVDHATSLYQFTRMVNDHYSYTEKCELVEAMWCVAFADDSLDKYEEHMIRRVAGLIYLPHEDFIHTKMRARQASTEKG